MPNQTDITFGTATFDTPGGSDWVDLDKALIQDGFYAESDLTNIGIGASTKTITVSIPAAGDYAGIPDNATIVGIRLNTTIRSTVADRLQNKVVRIKQGNTPGQDKAIPPYFYTDQWHIYTHGGTSDLWQTSGWTVRGATHPLSELGFEFQSESLFFAGAKVQILLITATVHWTAPTIAAGVIALGGILDSKIIRDEGY